MTLFYCSTKINKTFKMYTLCLIGKLTKMSMANHVQMLFRMIKYHHLVTSNSKKQIMVHSCDVKTKSYWLVFKCPSQISHFNRNVSFTSHVMGSLSGGAFVVLCELWVF